MEKSRSKVHNSDEIKCSKPFISKSRGLLWFLLPCPTRQWWKENNLHSASPYADDAFITRRHPSSLPFWRRGGEKMSPSLAELLPLESAPSHSRNGHFCRRKELTKHSVP
ncbi:hypothetical protein TNCV_731321 [Trichonephila clavipes]|nr:hypothetical protein TNCV_731321 [Trichonephila clavipes]